MSQRPTRRDVMTRTAAGVAGLAALGLPESVWALQDGDEPVTFTDYTDAFKIHASASRPQVRCVDLRNLTGWTTPNDEHYTFTQTSTPAVDAASYRLRIGGFVERPMELTLDQLKARRDRRDEAVTLECSGNSTRPQRMCGLLSNGVWSGVGLKSLLEECGVKPEAREVLFLGLDMEREKKFQAGNREYEAPHGRAIHLLDALAPDTMLAFALNGQPIPPDQGFPVRLLVPGWYGMTQVKWLGRIEVLDRRYEGQHQVRNYLSLRSVPTPDGPLWLDTSISRNRLKSIVARVTRRRHDGQWIYRVVWPGLGRLGADHGGRGAGGRGRLAAGHPRRPPLEVRLGLVVLVGPQSGAGPPHARLSRHRRHRQGAAHRCRATRRDRQRPRGQLAVDPRDPRRRIGAGEGGRA